MKNSIIMIMGGTASNDIANDRKYIKYVKSFKRIYVETNGMIKTLQKAGLKNVGYYPNGRFKPKIEIPKKLNQRQNKNLKCVFFSYITPSKGAQLILDVAKRMKNIQFHFYGKIDKLFECEFRKNVDLSENLYYNGIFTGEINEVYKELSKYDVLLFPSTWIAEGVPGILIESKISGLPAIVSNHNYNAEIVNDGFDGIVMEEVSATCLIKAINKIKHDSKLLYELSCNSKKSASKYFIESYIDEIKEDIIMRR